MGLVNARRSARIGAVLSLLCALVVAGCGGGNNLRSANAPDFEKDIQTWKMPLDDYYPALTQQNYAASLAIAVCMKRSSIVWPVENPADYLPPTYNARVRKMFDLNIAKRFGYHSGLDHQPADVRDPKLTADENAALTNCQQGAGAEVGLKSSSFGYVQGLAASAADKSLRSPAVKRAAGKWRDCMLPLGLPDLPDAPPGAMPTETQRVRFGLAQTDSANTKLRQPIPQEIREAEFDAKCRASSGYTAALYDAEVRYELDGIAKNPDKISRALSDAKKVNKRIRAILAENGS